VQQQSSVEACRSFLDYFFFLGCACSDRNSSTIGTPSISRKRSGQRGAVSASASRHCTCSCRACCIRQHTSAHVSIRSASRHCTCSCRLLHTSAYVSVRQRTSAYVSIRSASRRCTCSCRAYCTRHHQHTQRLQTMPLQLRRVLHT
jgi:hypothetical protein